MPIDIINKTTIQGFDPCVSPPWAMVPVGRRTVMLNVRHYGSLFPRSLNQEILYATQSHGVLSLTSGYLSGRTWIKWEGRGAHSDDLNPGYVLEVSVKAQIQIKTAFWYVTDMRHQVTTRKTEDLSQLIKAANDYLEPQANVVIVQKDKPKPLDISEDLGWVVRNVEGKPSEWDIITSHADPQADFNVFFVAEYESKQKSNERNTDAGGATDKSNNCILEDDTGYSIGKALAHETMHRWIHRHSDNRNHLIASGKYGIGPIITKAQANILNPSGT